MPNPMSTAAATKVPMPPRLFSHFPTLRPMILSTVRNASNTWVGYHPQLEAAILPQTETLAAEMERLLRY